MSSDVDVDAGLPTKPFASLVKCVLKFDVLGEGQQYTDDQFIATVVRSAAQHDRLHFVVHGFEKHICGRKVVDVIVQSP